LAQVLDGSRFGWSSSQNQSQVLDAHFLRGLTKGNLVNLTKEFLKKAMMSTQLESAKAFAEAALMTIEQTEQVDVIWEGRNSTANLIECIKQLRNEFALGLKEAKDVAESSGKVLTRLPPYEANLLKNRLEGVGGKISLK
jgi:ribosomal protein L7/L12